MRLPLVSEEEFNILMRMQRNASPLNKSLTCGTGEFDMTFARSAFTSNSQFPEMIRGAGIARYALLDKLSQGEHLFIDETKVKGLDYTKQLKESERIVLQGITGVNEKWRIKATLAKNIYCANSTNYILVGGSKARVLLGILNSHLMNFFFAKFSTNSNVNGYEVDVLPTFPVFTPEQQSRFVTIVDRILAEKKRNPAADTSALEREIDEKVYRLYGLTDDEIRVIEVKDKEEESSASKVRAKHGEQTLPSDGRAHTPSAPKKRKPKIVEEF